MQWSCPHCGINLAVADDVLGSGWSFSRCYKCGGFALIRRTEINVIKVDKAPPGEKVILPEASGDVTNAMLPESATKKLAKHTQNKPKIEKTHQAPAAGATASNPLQTHAAPSQTSGLPLGATTGYDITSSLLPEPLPEINGRSPIQSKTVPVGIAVAGVLAISSGIFLYVQGKALWNKTQETSFDAQNISSSKTTASALTEKRDVLSVEPAFNHAQTIALAPKASSPLITDQLQQSAMAPLKTVPTAANVHSVSQVEETKAAAPHTFQVKIRTNTANLHSGPGISYPVIATANPDTQYVVVDWSDRWFRLSTHNGTANQILGWVRNDLVQVLK